MSTARDAILARVRAAQLTAYLPPAQHGHPAYASSLRSVRGEESLGLGRFLKELDGLGVVHHVESSADGVRARVAAIVGSRTVLSWDGDQLPYDVGRALPAGAATGQSTRDTQAAAEIGVTGCHAAIVETGSLVVFSGPGTPRAASLLPPVHLCIVEPGRLHATMGEFFNACRGDIGATACCTFITGPSRTADIELTLTLGVHGPGKVIVVVGP